MSYLSFDSASSKSASRPAPGAAGSLRTAFAGWLLANHGAAYRQEINRQRARPNARQFGGEISACSQDSPTEQPLVGIVGGGFAGLYAGLVLQSLGIECEVFESSDRVGGRIETWYSSDYTPDDPDTAGLYGEVGGMLGSRWDLPQSLYTPLRQDAVLLENGAEQPAALALIDYLKGREARAVIERFGYGVE